MRALSESWAEVDQQATPVRSGQTRENGRAESYCVIFNIRLPLVPLTIAVTVVNPVPPSRVAMIGLVVVVDGMLISVDGLALQLASVVRSPPFSLDAVNINVVPFARLMVSDVHDVQVTVTALDVFVHNVPTHTVAVLLTAPAEETFVAVIVTLVDALVTDNALISPILLTLSTSGSELLHVVPDVAVIFRVVLSLYAPVAVSCSVPPAAVSDELEGVMLTLLKVGLTNQSQPTTNTNKRRVPRATAILD